MSAAELRAASDTPLTVVDCGEVAYETAFAWQKDLAVRRAAGEIGDTVLLLEHPRVFTLGKRADAANILWDADELGERGFTTFQSDRGGDVTYHGPGQLIAYPIIKLRDTRGVVPYVRALESIGIAVANKHGFEARAVDGYTGVWVGDLKLMAIGVRVTAGGVTQHGLGLNVTTDLSDFIGIVPCGIDEVDKGVCSLQSLGAAEVTIAKAKQDVAQAVAEVFGAQVVTGDLDALSL